MTSNTGLITDEARELRALAKVSDSIELKLTLATKCLPGEGLDAAEQLHDLLTSKGISLDGEQQTKTKTALEFFSAEPHPSAAPTSAPAAPRRLTRATTAAANGAAGGSR